MKLFEAEAVAEKILGHSHFVMYTTPQSAVLNRGKRYYISTGKRGGKNRVEAFGASWEAALNSLRNIIEKRAILEAVMMAISVQGGGL